LILIFIVSVVSTERRKAKLDLKESNKHGNHHH